MPTTLCRTMLTDPTRNHDAAIELSSSHYTLIRLLLPFHCITAALMQQLVSSLAIAGQLQVQGTLVEQEQESIRKQLLAITHFSFDSDPGLVSVPCLFPLIG